ncbi:MAG: hypothetical protein WCX20_02195 [Candidatus Shapirobacteria bacterium]
MEPYFYIDGIRKLADELSGDENIYLGIRPYGFHAGNMSTLVVYPLLLCKELNKLGKVPRFNFYVFINDWEQQKLDGVDPKLYPFNILPKYTTWQFMPDPIDEKFSIVDFWEPIIINNINFISRYFPFTKVIPVRNSSMREIPIMKKCLLKTIKHPEVVLKILKDNSTKLTLDKAIYASAVCPKCHAARGNSKVLSKSYILHNCTNCHTKTKDKYENFEYWFYHKPLALPRIAAFKIDLCITGADHYQEGDFTVRQKLMEAYKIKNVCPKTLYAPTIFGRNNFVMGKSKGNSENIGLDKLIQLIQNNPKSEIIKIPDII